MNKFPFVPTLLTEVNAIPEDIDKYILQLKYDGVRFARSPEGKVFSRKALEFPVDLSGLFENLPLGRWWEGEIYSETLACAEVSGFLQRKTGKTLENLAFVVFDTWEKAIPYQKRLELIPEEFRPKTPELDAIPAWCDGIVLRDKTLNYYNGRSPWDLKFKVRQELDCKILEAYPRMENENPQEFDAFGYAKRSTSQVGLIETEFVGSFQVLSPTGVEFSVGSGIPRNWNINDKWAGKTAVIAYNGIYSSGIPRFPRLIEVR